jgi:hypothetical protein
LYTKHGHDVVKSEPKAQNVNTIFLLFENIDHNTQINQSGAVKTKIDEIELYLKIMPSNLLKRFDMIVLPFCCQRFKHGLMVLSLKLILMYMYIVYKTWS